MKKSGLILGLLLLAALAGLVWYELRKDEQLGVMQPGTLVFPYNPGRVQEFSVIVGERSATLRRSASGGFEAVGETGGVVPEQAADFLAAIGRLRFLDVVQETATDEDLGRFGLKPPLAAVRITLRPPTREGERVPATPPALELGGSSPVLPGYYARVNGFPRVVLVGAEAADLVEGVGLELFGEASQIPEPSRESGLRELPKAPRRK
ncbi:MAG: DUF4340 domain-containing protein [Acidobacteria bacterium]|nr:DUF4340 domain-containing protein [Acidobacteriota bacterium]MCU0253801.1 DUF4340 domain-containing protein [Acidobacteriota bacterium]